VTPALFCRTEGCRTDAGNQIEEVKPAEYLRLGRRWNVARFCWLVYSTELRVF